MKADDVLQLEKELSFYSFSHEDAFLIASQMIERVKKEHLKNIRIRVVFDGDIVFQYLMDGKKGDIWLNRKQNTVEKFGHSSYYVFLENQEHGTYQQYEDDETLVICGGGFPIIVQGQMRGCFIVSGLEHDQDHQLIVDAFQEYKRNIQYALASDIDGTLFLHDINGYKDGDLKAIYKFQKSGHLFGVCTGRALCSLDDIRKLNLDFYIVTSGAVLLDKDFQIIEEHPISKELAREVFNEYKDKTGVIVQTGSQHHFYSTFTEIKSDELYLVKDFDDIQEDKIYGISIVVDSDEKAGMLKKEIDHKYPELEGFQNKNSIDIVKKGCSKGVATRKMKQLLKVDVISGIGDSYNDIPLITNSDIGFTFYDSPKSVQDQATYLVNDIAQAINQLMEDQL